MTSPGVGAGRGRRPGQTETRADILEAARRLFAEKGYDGASLRAIARASDVDPALVHHYFGSKEGLFIAALEVPIEPARFVPLVVEGPRDGLGERMVRTFLGIWEDEANRLRLLAIVRSALAGESGAVMLREFLSAALLGRVADSLGVPRLRITAAAGQMLGIAVLRYVVRVEPMASASVDEIAELVAPTIQRYFTG